MIAIGVFLIWAAFGLGVWGVALVRGWNLGFADIWSPTHYYAGSWPPQLAGNTVIIPDGTKASTLSASFQGSSSSGSSTSGGGGSAPAQPAGLSGMATIQKAAALFGWGSGQQWNCLTHLIARESGGSPNALNSSSGAYGEAQSLTHGGCGGASCGHNEYCGYGLSVAQTKQANCGNLWYQAIWQMGYIKAIHKTPCDAWANYCNHPNGACYY